MRYILVPALSAILSLISTPLVTRLAAKLKIIDYPVGERWHKFPTPGIGGLAIFTSFVVTSVLFVPFQRETLVILLGAVGVFALGFLDDKFGTFPLGKFIAQFVIALGIVGFGIRLRIMPPIVAIPFTLVWIVMITNAFNLIDNMDGLSAGVAFIASMTFFLFSWKRGQVVVPVLALALAGSCLGFLRYNFNPAKIFMGDCGSLFIGYTLSTLAILGFWQKSSPVFPLLTAPILVLGYAVFDTVLVTILRLKIRSRPWIGGKDHSSHRMVRLGLSERGTVLLIYALGIVGGVSAFAILRIRLAMAVLLVALLCIVAVVFGWFLGKAKE